MDRWRKVGEVVGVVGAGEWELNIVNSIRSFRQGGIKVSKARDSMSIGYM